MADIFISYSRKDAEFARRLHSQLQQEGRDVWIDWDDIPLTADWWTEICGGIEAADGFIFIISPASLSSPVCNLEMDYARQQNKRLIPVVRARPNDEVALSIIAATELEANMRATLGGRELVAVARENWQALSRYNWVFFDNDNTFESSYHDLASAIDTDLSYVREHTRLLVRANEWNRKGRSKSFLLRREDLNVAENWLATRGDKQPEPTDLHQQYIFTSRTVERINQRRLLAGVTTALIVTLILAALALLAFQNANVERHRADSNAHLASTNEARAVAESTLAAQERDRANFQARIALSRQLAAQASDFRDEHLDLALLLGVEGLLRHNEPGTESAVLQVLEAAPQLQYYLRGHNKRITAVAVRPDGQVIVSGDIDGQVILWDVSSGQRIGLTLDVIFAVNALHFGPDENQITISTIDGALAVWDVNAREVVQQLRNPHSAPALIAGETEDTAEFTADGRRIVTANMDGDIAIWDTSSGQIVETIAVGTGILGDEQIETITIAPNGALVAFSVFNHAATDTEQKITITLWKSGDSNQQKVAVEGVAGIPLDFSSDSSTLAFAERALGQSTLQLWDVESGTIKQTLPIDFDPRQLAFGQDDRHIFVTSEQGDITVIDVDSGERVLPLTRGHSANISVLALFADGRHFVTASDDTRLALWDLHSYSQIARPLAPDTKTNQVVFNSDGTLIALADNQMIEIHKVADNSVVIPPFEADPDFIMQLLFHPSKNVLASFGSDQVKLWDVSGNEARLLATLEHPSLSSMTFGPGGQSFMTTSFDGSIRIWDTESGKLLNEPKLSFGGTLLENMAASPVIQSVAVSPDGHTLATNHLQAIYLWKIDENRITSEEPLMTLESPLDDSALFWAAQFSPDGRLLVASSDNGALIVWNIATGQLALPPLLGHQSIAWSLSFDPTSRILASGSYDDGLRLWDITSGDSLGDPLEKGLITSANFSPVLVQNGPLLASAGEQVPSLWYLNAESWRSSACARSKLLINDTEWQTYLGETPYRITCPEVALSQADYLSLSGEQQAADLMAQAVASATEYDNAALNDAVCRYGTLDLFYEIVLLACNQAIALEPENGFYHDSRGLARALDGDSEGAIEDFTTFVEWSHENDLYDTAGRQRESWIETLQRGETPFDLETRKALRVEFAARSSYHVTIADMVPLLPSELPSPPQPMTSERLAEKIAEANLPFDPMIPPVLVNGLPGWFLDGASRVDRSTLDENSQKLLAPGPDAFGLRLLPMEGEGLIAIFQSNGPNTNLNEWSNDAAGAFVALRLNAEEDETLMIEGVEVRKFVMTDAAHYFFIFNDLQFVVYAYVSPPDTDLLERIIAAIVTTRS